MADNQSDDEKRGIWERITLDQLATAIASLGDRSEELKKETWRLNAKTRENSRDTTFPRMTFPRRHFRAVMFAHDTFAHSHFRA